MLEEDVEFGGGGEGEGGKRPEELSGFGSNGLARSQDAKALVGVVGRDRADRMIFDESRKVECVRRHLYNRVLVVWREYTSISEVADLPIMSISARHAEYAFIILRR